jgi:predicted secreted protein
MRVINRSRLLRPLSRAVDSPYKVDTAGVGGDAVLRLTIRDQATPSSILAVFEFRGRDVSARRSVHFTVARSDGRWKVTFSGAKPFSATI